MEAFIGARDGLRAGPGAGRRATRWRCSAGSTTRSRRSRTTSPPRGARRAEPNATRIQDAIVRNEDQIKTLQSLRKRGGEGPLPTPHWLSFALGSAYFRSGDLVKAEQEYRAALAQKPDLGEAHLNLAVVCMLTGRLDEADREVALAEKAGLKVPQGLKDDIQKRRQH